MIKNLYHCTINEYMEQPADLVALHIEFYGVEIKTQTTTSQWLERIYNLLLSAFGSKK